MTPTIAGPAVGSKKFGTAVFFEKRATLHAQTTVNAFLLGIRDPITQVFHPFRKGLANSRKPEDPPVAGRQYRRSLINEPPHQFMGRPEEITSPQIPDPRVQGRQLGMERRLQGAVGRFPAARGPRFFPRGGTSVS